MKRFGLASLVAALFLLVTQSGAQAGTMTIYDSLYNPLPSNVVSEGYQCCQMSSFGDEIQFAGSYRDLSTATLTLSNWAAYSDVANDPQYASNASSVYNTTGFSIPLTLTLYNVGAGNTLGSQITSVTINPMIMWRPEYTGCDGNGGGFIGADGACDHGLAQNVTFDLSGTKVPDQVIYALSFDTGSYGANPYGYTGPYDSLNFGLNGNCIGTCATAWPAYAGSGISVGSEVNPGYLWYDTAGYDLAGGTVNQLSQNDYGSLSSGYFYAPAIKFNAVPEPSSIALLCGAFAVLGFATRRRRRAAKT